MIDPVQFLIDAGAIPSTPFEPESRYHGVPIAVLQRRPGEPGVLYVRRRFIPAPANVIVTVHHHVIERDRPDLLAARYLGDSLLYWRIADANTVIDPHELTDTVGRRVVIPEVGGA